MEHYVEGKALVWAFKNKNKSIWASVSPERDEVEDEADVDEVWSESSSGIMGKDSGLNSS
jgi:hypothetical protein